MSWKESEQRSRLWFDDSLYVFWIEKDIQVIVDKTQLLLKKCTNDIQKLKETNAIIFVIYFIPWPTLQRFILTEMSFSEISHCISHSTHEFILTLFDMGFFEPSVMVGGGEGRMMASHHNFVVTAPLTMKFCANIKLDAFYTCTLETKTFVTSLLLFNYDVMIRYAQMVLMILVEINFQHH